MMPMMNPMFSMMNPMQNMNAMMRSIAYQNTIMNMQPNQEKKVKKNPEEH